MQPYMKRFSVQGRRALITGASKGIGFEICRVLAEAGADIVAVARDPGGLAEVRAAVERSGRECLAIGAELESIDGPRDAAREALDHFGTIDILVNNAATTAPASLLETSVEDWDRMMAVNLRAPFLLAQEIAPKMIERKRGKIVNISSQTSVVLIPDHCAYAASKNGLNALTRAMTCEWAQYNIQCNAICPTVILTPMGERVWGQPEKGDPMKAKIPAGRFGLPVEVADTVLYLSSAASDLVNGDLLMLDGGYTAL
ncbi:MAG: SDR family oxidoreductase [Boseongicola sp. SB0677_bin_26]|nr:SDR family oxidoreductase [Boseongicola sp. SB0665_bin_10]MYG28513.1 SDR family oxidoreductase [Boseongicola sp. SB0677_bin_26]